MSAPYLYEEERDQLDEEALEQRAASLLCDPLYALIAAEEGDDEVLETLNILNHVTIN